MRLPLVAGNWKMNTTVAEARDLARNLVQTLNEIDGVEVLLCPPSISLVPVKEAIRGSSLKLGAQNMHFEDKGAFTGEISPVMLQGLCEYVILGHSERRHVFGENDQLVNQKVKAAQGKDLIPILCIGETLEQRKAGKTEEILVSQTRNGLQDIDQPAGLVVAYEPVWAIGTGIAATESDANLAIELVRNTLADLLGRQAADETRILYGGSVNADNIDKFMGVAEIDGALVGGASLKVDQFTRIVEAAAESRRGS